ncbi:MAG: hypothetical protein HY903_11550 [Deltaproteobacteria bacterium]|nr:hypothetical protein [Deltaproteobacteria bacterium]
MVHSQEVPYTTYLRFFGAVKSGQKVDASSAFYDSGPMGSMPFSPERTAAASLGIQDATNGVKMMSKQEFEQALGKHT